MNKYLIIFMSILIFSCNKEELEISDTYEVTVLGEGIDCKLTLIEFHEKDLDRLEEVMDEASAKGWLRYNAYNLDEKYNIPGQVLKVKVRKPKDDELYACTFLDPSYPWVTILKVETVK